MIDQPTTMSRRPGVLNKGKGGSIHAMAAAAAAAVADSGGKSNFDISSASFSSHDPDSTHLFFVLRQFEQKQTFGPLQLLRGMWQRGSYRPLLLLRTIPLH